MRAIVTGAGGFVGLNVVEALLARGDDVLALDVGPLHPYAETRLRTLPGTLACDRVDVACAHAVAPVFEAFRPTHVVHAAAITPGPEREASDFDRIVDVNVKGAHNVLAAAAAARVRRVVYVSSGSVYGKALFRDGELSEDHAACPDTLYAITKFAAERLCARAREQAGLDVVCARLGSVFGPWERDTGVRDTLSLPFQMLCLARSGETISTAQREPRRDWIYSRDVASGILALLDAASLGHELYNLSAGYGGAPIVAAWAERLRTRHPLDFGVAESGERPNVEFLGARDRAPMRIDRIRADTGFRPCFTLSAALDDHAAWLASNPAYHERQRD